VRFLLDTPVVLWLVGDPAKVPPRVRRVLADRSNELLVSAISVLEVATKARLGKLPEGDVLLQTWGRCMSEIAATELPVGWEHARTAGSLRWAHRDPFDRVLVAQAACDGLQLVTTDRAVRAYDGVAVLAW